MPWKCTVAVGCTWGDITVVTKGFSNTFECTYMLGSARENKLGLLLMSFGAFGISRKLGLRIINRPSCLTSGFLRDVN